MGNITVDSRGSFGSYGWTKHEFHCDVTQPEVQTILAKLAGVDFGRDGKLCYVFGMGAHPRSSYSELAQLKGIEIVFTRSMLHPALRVLQYFVASQEGVVRINHTSALPVVFEKLMNQAMVALYVFDARLESTFIDGARRLRQTHDFSCGVKNDPGYLMYCVYADSDESSSGIVEIVSFGREFKHQEIFADDFKRGTPLVNRQSDGS